LFHCMRVVADGEASEQLFEGQAKLTTFCNLMKNCLEVVAEQREKYSEMAEEQARNVEIDEEDLQDVQEQLDKITGAAIYINECCGILMEVYGADVAGLLD
jgi:hypothetical protein